MEDSMKNGLEVFNDDAAMYVSYRIGQMKARIGSYLDPIEGPVNQPLVDAAIEEVKVLEHLRNLIIEQENALRELKYARSYR